MATSRVQKFLDQIGVSTLWARILQELDKKASQTQVDNIDTELHSMELYGGSATDVMEEND